MVARTSGNSRSRTGNPLAAASVVVGLAAVLSIPAGVVLSYYSQTVTLVEATSSAGLAVVFGVYAIALARRGRWMLARTLGRARGAHAARAGRLLGWLGLCMGISTALAVGFYGLLRIFVKG